MEATEADTAVTDVACIIKCTHQPASTPVTINRHGRGLVFPSRCANCESSR